MSQLNPLSYPSQPATEAVEKSPFPFSTNPQNAAGMPATGASASPPPPPPGSNERMKQLEQMLKEMQGRAETVEKEAYDKAYLAGENAGMALGQKRAEQILQALQTTLSEAEHSIQQIGNGFAEAALDVASHLAEVIVGREIGQDISTLYEIARQAAGQLPQAESLKIAVSTDDYLSFKRLLDESDSFAMLVSDDSVEPGSCRIVSSTQDILIDPAAAVSNCLNQLMPALLKPIDIQPKSEVESPDEPADQT